MITEHCLCMMDYVVLVETTMSNVSSDYQFDLRNDSLSEDVYLQIFLWVLCIVTVLGNVLVIATFIREKELRSKVSNLYILNLSVADLFVGIIVISSFNIDLTMNLSDNACKFKIIMDFSTCSVSVWAVVLISHDRYVLVTKGLKYGQFQTYRKCVITCLITWFVSYARYIGTFVVYDLVVATSTIHTSGYCNHEVLQKSPFIVYDLITSYAIPVIFNTYFNARLYGNIRKRSRGLPRNWAAVEPQEDINNRSEVTAANPPIRRDGTNDFHKHRRAAITLGLLVGVSSLCWVPYYTIVFLEIIADVPISNTVYTTAQYVFFGNSAINPLLYVATNPRIRNSMVKMFYVFKR